MLRGKPKRIFFCYGDPKGNIKDLTKVEITRFGVYLAAICQINKLVKKNKLFINN